MYAPIQTFVPLDSPSAPSTDPNYPFPPFYDSGNFLWSTPYFITPTALLAFLLLAGLGRYLAVVRDSATTAATSSDPRDAHRSLETHLSNASTLLPSGHARRDSRLLSHDPPLDKFVYALGFIIAATFIAEAAVVCARALAVKQWTSIALAYYDGVSWLAWTINFVLLVTEKRKFGKWSWVQYTFWWASGVGESMIAWMWVSGIMHPRDGGYSDV
ncbi:hypothetical protein BC937DRAFT_95477 [Endogone sp. FLAS-F59071]|nr:hypothetical protein BC937DRAFT_95477 [Endogone sp. FLAS-F59071]|eukprot:RUS20325.1 hypothetical protein BC937DRAFT_95477 [Endogone sp. FLAS-F59071]